MDEVVCVIVGVSVGLVVINDGVVIVGAKGVVGVIPTAIATIRRVAVK